MKKLALTLIRYYQRTLSFDHSDWGKKLGVRVCRFYPSCSQYSIEAIEKYGLTKGLFKGLYRILRCNPFTKGGIDYP